MKKKHGFLIGFAVIAIAAMFTFAGCDDGSTDSDGSKNTSDGKPVRDLMITSYPTKTNYRVGENLDLTGLAVKAYYENSDPEENFTAYSLVLSAGYFGAIENGTPIETTHTFDVSGSFRIYIKSTASPEKTAPFNVVVFNNITKDSFTGTWGELPNSPSDYQDFKAVITSINAATATLAVTYRRNSDRAPYSAGTPATITATITWGAVYNAGDEGSPEDGYYITSTTPTLTGEAANLGGNDYAIRKIFGNAGVTAITSESNTRLSIYQDAAMMQLRIKNDDSNSSIIIGSKQEE